MDADFLFMKCIKCNEQFFEPELFKSHMREVHLVADGINAPHGIMHKGLSLVVYPEEPGIDAANVSLLETKQADFLRLAEVVINEHGGNYSVSKTPMKLKEPEDEHGCEPNERWDGQQCVPIESDTAEEQDEHGCGPDETWDAEQEKCVKKPETTEQEEDHGCGEDEVWNPVTQKCESVHQAVEHLDEIFVKGTKVQLKQTYEKILRIADNNVREIKEILEKKLASKLEVVIFDNKRIMESQKNVISYIGELEERIKAVEKSTNPSLKETEELTSKVKSMEKRLIEMENHYSHIRGNFKGHNKNVEPKQEATGRPSYSEQSRK